MKGTQHQLPIFCQNVQIFCHQIELLRKSSDFWILGLTNVTLMLRKFIISKLRILIQKLIVVKGSNCFVHGDKFLPIFQILIFLCYKPL